MTDMKLNILRIMTEILLENTSKTYIRHLSSRIIMLINTCKHEFANETDSATIATIKATFAKWKETKVFTDAFYNRILATAVINHLFRDRLLSANSRTTSSLSSLSVTAKSF